MSAHQGTPISYPPGRPAEQRNTRTNNSGIAKPKRKRSNGAKKQGPKRPQPRARQVADPAVLVPEVRGRLCVNMPLVEFGLLEDKLLCIGKGSVGDNLLADMADQILESVQQYCPPTLQDFTRMTIVRDVLHALYSRNACNAEELDYALRLMNARLSGWLQEWTTEMRWMQTAAPEYDRRDEAEPEHGADE